MIFATTFLYVLIWEVNELKHLIIFLSLNGTINNRIQSNIIKMEKKLIYLLVWCFIREVFQASLMSLYRRVKT